MNKSVKEKGLHTFAVCAYKESPYLEECIRTLLNQTVRTNIIVATSTPCDFISDICSRYGLPLYVNEGESGITQDWNFAISKCETDIVTVAHQDDIYDATYVEELFGALKGSKHPIMFFTDYDELRNGERVHDVPILKIKRKMLAPLRLKLFQGNKWVRRRILSIGDPICCPSVSFFRSNTPETIFQNHFRTNEDWEAWEILSRRKGEFLYCPRPLMAHRIHADSETSATIRETGRSAEDLEMYLKFWPRWIAKIFCAMYKKSESSNDL